MFGARDAEADADGLVAGGADTGQEGLQLGRQLRTSAGDAGARDAVDEAGGVFGDECDPLRSGGWSDQEDRRDSVLLGGGFPGCRFFRRQIGQNRAVCSGFGEDMREAFQAVLQSEVIGSHQDDWDFRVGANVSYHLQDGVRGHTRL